MVAWNGISLLQALALLAAPSSETLNKRREMLKKIRCNYGGTSEDSTIYLCAFFEI